jgi:hypothetical protein
MRRLTLFLTPLLLMACGRELVAPAPRYGVSGRPDCPSCANLPHGSPDGSVLLVSYPGGASGSTATSDPTVPAGATFCLSHGNPFPTMESGQPLPSSIPSTDLVGCDRSFAAGASYVVDFDAENTPGFANFATLMTNGIDETVSSMVAFVDGTLHVVHLGSGGGIDEAGLTDRRINGGTSIGGLTGPDLTGFTLDRVRLVVSSLQFSVEPQATGYTFSFHYTGSWEFWGRIAASKQ